MSAGRSARGRSWPPSRRSCSSDSSSTSADGSPSWSTPTTSPPRPPAPGASGSTRPGRSKGAAHPYPCAAAKAAAHGYLEAAGVDGTVTVRDGTTVTVAVHDTYDTVFLAAIGIGRLDATGTASARVTRTFGGNER